MNEVQIFESEEFGSVRTIMVCGELVFVANDIAKILGYSNPRDAINKHVDDEDKGVAECDTPGGVQRLAVINESGMYSLVLSSKLPNAKKFKRWITSEVIPSIRKNGGYIAGQESLSDEELMAKAVLVAQKKIAERDAIIAQQAQKIEADRPKTVFADAVSTSKTSILIGDLAKLLRQNGVDIGQKRFFEYLRSNGYLIKRKGSDWNMPTQRSMELGLFEIKESTHIDGNGCNIVTRTPKATGKAQIYFVNKFLGELDNERLD